MSTASNELRRTVEREESGEPPLRQTQAYRDALEEAKSLLTVAETFTQGTAAKRLAMADALSQQHRTHQQGFVRGVIIPALAALEFNAEQNYFDARNEGATRFAQHALAAADEHNDTWMPFI